MLRLFGNGRGSLPVTSAKNNNFNIIRFIAAFMVIYGHMSSIMGMPAQTVLAQRVSTIGVKTIFVISGYLIAKSFLSDSHFGRFMVRRCLRIFPPLFLLILLSAFVLGPVVTVLPLKEYLRNGNTLNYLKNIVLFPVYALPGVFTECPFPNAVNGSLWTLPVEFSLYLILPGLLMLLKKMGSMKIGLGITAALLLVLSLVQLAFFESARVVFWGTNWVSAIALLPYYFIGCLFALPDMKKYLNIQVSLLLMALAALCSTNPVLNELAVAVALPYFVLSAGLIPNAVFGRFFEKADFSYGIYLYGFPVQQVLFQLLAHKQPGVLGLSVLSFAAAFVFAVISWFALEKHMQTLSKKLIQYWKSKNKTV